MNLQTAVDQYIEQEICDKYELYSIDHISPNQVNWIKDQYYKALFDLIKERVDL